MHEIGRVKLLKPEVDLKKLARGQDCKIRETGVCNFHTETTVLAHWRQVGISGAGTKAPDVMGAHACSCCHDFVDGRTHPGATREQRENSLLRGIMNTQYWLIREGYLKW